MTKAESGVDDVSHDSAAATQMEESSTDGQAEVVADASAGALDGKMSENDTDAAVATGASLLAAADNALLEGESVQIEKDGETVVNEDIEMPELGPPETEGKNGESKGFHADIPITDFFLFYFQYEHVHIVSVILCVPSVHLFFLRSLAPFVNVVCSVFRGKY